MGFADDAYQPFGWVGDAMGMGMDKVSIGGAIYFDRLPQPLAIVRCIFKSQRASLYVLWIQYEALCTEHAGWCSVHQRSRLQEAN